MLKFTEKVKPGLVIRTKLGTRASHARRTVIKPARRISGDIPFSRTPKKVFFRRIHHSFAAEFTENTYLLQ